MYPWSLLCLVSMLSTKHTVHTLVIVLIVSIVYTGKETLQLNSYNAILQSHSKVPSELIKCWF